MNIIPENENLDILLILASTFENTLPESVNKSLIQLAEEKFSALPAEKQNAIKKRAGFIDKLPAENRDIWREICLGKLLNRDRTIKLDQNINPVHIGVVLSRESFSIQKHILKNLPLDLSKRIAQYLGIEFENEPQEAIQINESIDDLIKNEFMSHFVSLEDIYEPIDIDRISLHNIVKFINHLGLREIAIACRGINSKETLAAFLNSFNPDNTREIVEYLTELEKVKPIWVARADEMVRDNWDSQGNPEQVISKIGFKLLAISFIERDAISRKYTYQKLTSKNAQYWRKILQQIEKERNSDNSLKTLFENRCKIIQKSATRFLQNGRV